MKRLYSIFLIFLIFILFSGCGQKNLNKEAQDIETPEYLYSLAINNFDNENYDIAIENFNEIELKYPLSSEAVQSQIMVAFIEYLSLNYDEAIFKLDRIINRYPSHKNIDYVYYIKAICYYEQIQNEFLDGSFNLLALQSFEQVINRFPDSEYSSDSLQKIITIKENIAAKHMDVALFYFKNKKYLAAMNRYKIVINNHSTSKFVPEALHRLVEIYFTLGMVDDAKKTAAVIAHNYPKSKWYEYSYDLVKDREEQKKNFLQKILKTFSNENE